MASGTTATDIADTGLEPTEFVATTLKRYAAPLLRAEIKQEVAASAIPSIEVAVQVPTTVLLDE